jgi:hypothetical protein
MENLAAAIRVARLYRDGVLPVDQISLESAIASYRTGTVPFLTVLEALNTLYADRARLLARLADAEKWRVSIDEADLLDGAGMKAAPTAAATMGPDGAVSGITSSSPMR